MSPLTKLALGCLFFHSSPLAASASYGSMIRLASTANLELRGEWADGESSVTIVSREPDRAGRQHWSSDTYPTTFGVFDLASGGSHTLFVAGTTDGGKHVVELWNLDMQSGSYVVDVPGSPEWIFLPPYVAPADRPQRREPTRSTIFEGDLPGELINIVADPEQRFVYCLLADPRFNGAFPTVLYSFETRTGKATALYSSESTPALRQACGGMMIAEHASLGGRAIVLQCYGPVHWTVIWDANADGIPDSLNTYTYEEVSTMDWKVIWS